MKVIHNLPNTAIETTKNHCLERESNSHLRVSRPPLYPLSCRANGPGIGGEFILFKCAKYLRDYLTLAMNDLDYVVL